MAGSREPVFTNDEKIYMLAEIIKSVSPSPTTMLNLVMQLGAHQPRWDDMALPPGRSVNACRAAFEDLKRSSGYSPLSQTTAPQTPLSAPIGPLRRPWQLETATSYASAPPGRQLLPKTKSEGQAGVMVMSQSSATPGNQTKRKRGRPTKAEAQAKAAESSAAAAAGTLVRRESAITPRVANPGPSAAPSPALGPASAPATIASPSVEPQSKPSLPPTNRVPISAMITTPNTQKTSSRSGSSSGKRRRRKSMRSEQDDPREAQSEPMPMGPAQPQHSQHHPYPYPHYESPYGRIEPDETPARATGMRHYDDPLPGISIGSRLPPTTLPRAIQRAILETLPEVILGMGPVQRVETAIYTSQVDHQVDRTQHRDPCVTDFETERTKLRFSPHSLYLVIQAPTLYDFWSTGGKLKAPKSEGDKLLENTHANGQSLPAVDFELLHTNTATAD